MTRLDVGDWTIPIIVLQLVGLACLIVAICMIYTLWHGVGVFGFALLTVGEIRAGRKIPLL